MISLVESNLLAQVDLVEGQKVVNLLMIYDKSKTATITDKELKDLIKTFHSDQ